MSSPEDSLKALEIHERFKEVIYDTGLTVNAFSKKYGIGRNGLYSYSLPSCKLLMRMVEVTGKSADWFLFGKE